jgi:hypothetical protein
VEQIVSQGWQRSSVKSSYFPSIQVQFYSKILSPRHPVKQVKKVSHSRQGNGQGTQVAVSVSNTSPFSHW